jgi:phosphoribosyl-ATP pyrophosphohydrolase/phosphoribosyl-AMP cyclohydrolase
VPDTNLRTLTWSVDKQGVALEDVMAVLRSRFGTSGIEEKAARPPK